jgi:hypothetical protein
MAIHYSPRWNIQQSYRVSPSFTPKLLLHLESGSFEATDQSRGHIIYSNGTAIVNSDSPRSYRMSQLRNVNGAWTLVASNGYDVYGDTNAAAAARTFLQGFAEYDMLALNTWDEPYNNAVAYLYDTLTNDFGAKVAQYTRDFRDMYLLVAVKNKGVIYEEHRARYSNAILFSGWLR